MMCDYKRIIELLKKYGKFEILNPEVGVLSLTADGKTASTEVDIDTLTRGAGMENASEFSEYMDLLNPIFLIACDDLMQQLGIWTPEPIE